MKKKIHSFPPTYVLDDHRSNATNYAFKIVIKKGIEKFGAVLCQERAEWGYKWKRGYLPVKLSRALLRRMEYFGHAVEVEVAVRHYGADRDEYEMSEAIGMGSGWYDQFYGYSVLDIKAKLEEHREAAKKWVDRHPDYVAKAVSHNL